MSTNTPLLNLYTQGKSVLLKTYSSVVSKWAKQEARRLPQSLPHQETQCREVFFESPSHEQSNAGFADPKKARKQLQDRRDWVQKHMSHSAFENAQNTQPPVSDQPSEEQKKNAFSVESALDGDALSPTQEGS